MRIKTPVRTFLTCVLACCFLFLNAAAGADDIDTQITAKAAILVEAETGRVLYARNPSDRMYPASMTKMLTALVALDYLKPDELIVAGEEVSAVPYDSSKAGHFAGESLLVEHLIRGLIIPSGNETACVVANAVARRVQAGTDMTYAQAEKLFCSLMEKKAREIGAKSSNFMNPHGYHDPDHYTTAYDMALIARAAMANELIAEIADEKEFVGNGAGPMPDPTLKTKLYEWTTHNELIGAGEYSYPYATGIKTGFTDEAGECLTASATKDGVSLIAIAFDSPDSGRWTDCIKLFDYGFDTFAYRTVQQPSTIIDVVSVARAKLGESDRLNVTAQGAGEYFMSAEELARVQQELSYDVEFIAPVDVVKEDALEKEKRNRKQAEETAEEPLGEATKETYSGVILLAPIEKGTIVGRVTYTLDGDEIYSDRLIAAGDISQRTTKSDRQYYWNEFKVWLFSAQAIPFWAGGAALIVTAALLARWVLKRRGRRRSVYRIRKRF